MEGIRKANDWQASLWADELIGLTALHRLGCYRHSCVS